MKNIEPSCLFHLKRGEEIDGVKLKSVIAEYGIALVNVDFADPEGLIMQKIAEDIGVINNHNVNSDSGLWHIKIKINEEATDDSGQLIRSYTDAEFPMHTDCSYEDDPPRLFSLFVLQKDRLGGGKNRLVRSADLIEKLSPATVEILRKTNFTLRVPPGFKKDKESVTGPILTGKDLFRYRRDCVIDETPDQLRAIFELEQALVNNEIVTDLYLDNGTLLILDNARFLHARDKILDRDRHLLRMRFYPKDNWLPFCEWKVEDKN
jgi:alpha-ketoglutarate-dependent taurine dioxygenase